MRSDKRPFRYLAITAREMPRIALLHVGRSHPDIAESRTYCVAAFNPGTVGCIATNRFEDNVISPMRHHAIGVMTIECLKY